MTAKQTIDHINAIAAISKQAPLLSYEMQKLGPGIGGVDEIKIQCSIQQLGSLKYTLGETLTGDIPEDILAICQENLAARTLAGLLYELLNK